MDSNVRTDRETRDQNYDLHAVGAILCLAALLLCGCASTVKVTDKLPASSDLPEGYGTVIGSILMSAPTGVSDIEKQKMIDSLKAKKCEATIRSFLSHDYGLAEWTEHPGDKYRVSFEIDVEKRFIIRAPAGSYSFEKISQIVSGIFGRGCTMDGVANFDIHEGKMTYIGQLTIIAGFMSEEKVKMTQFLKNWKRTARGGMPEQRGVPEQNLTMRISVIDAKEKTLRDLGMDKSRSAIGLDTELMKVGGDGDWGNWHSYVAPIPAPLGVPRHR